jgi:hypothetical protein
MASDREFMFVIDSCRAVVGKILRRERSFWWQGALVVSDMHQHVGLVEVALRKVIIVEVDVGFVLSVGLLEGRIIVDVFEDLVLLVRL